MFLIKENKCLNNIIISQSWCDNFDSFTCNKDNNFKIVLKQGFNFFSKKINKGLKDK